MVRREPGMTIFWCLLGVAVSFVIGYLVGRMHSAYRFYRSWKG